MMFFIFGIYLFLYFGSGAGSISSNAQFANNIGTWFIIITPIVFNLYMIFLSLKTKDIEKKKKQIHLNTNNIYHLYNLSIQYR
jgi:hypothetical protein